MRQLKRQNWPYKVTIVPPDDNSIEKWFEDKKDVLCGLWRSIYRYHNNKVDYYFTNGNDATMFSLRWS